MKILVLFLFFLFFLFKVDPSYAIADPLSSPNNKFGVHILFPTELNEAANLVNSNGGDWGYVTIPIQGTDKDREKWQKFMDDASKLHVIPIVRIATENYYFNTIFWRKPKYDDVLDFANFLNSLSWPTKNKYVVIFNEVNRADEWEGALSSEEYTQILNYASYAFKSTNEDFFVISAGLDNAAPDKGQEFMNQYNFMVEMNKTIPGIFSQIDGLGSHAYPNPAFSQAPWITTNKSISSFRYEKDLAKRLGGKDLPVFITETGWSKDKLSDDQIASYFKFAFENIWSDKSIVAVTPFILHAGNGPFSQFSLIDGGGKKTKTYAAIQNISKVKGEPILQSNSAKEESKIVNPPVRKFPKNNQYKDILRREADTASGFFKWLLKSLNVL